jgi:tetratricopeptide (TPR) repeat protein
LDNIILAALRKEPQRRYSSAAEFSEDIRRHMEGMPVMAREDLIAYRCGKFIRRNKLAVAAASVLIAGLVFGIVATTLQARRADRRFQLVREMANTLVVDLNGQMERLPGSTALRASMIHTVVRYLDGLAQDEGGDPALDAEIADAYCRVAGVEGHPFRQNLGQTGSALGHYRKSLEMYEKLSKLPETRTRAVEAMIGCLIEAGDVEARTGNSQAAAARLEKVAALEREFSGRNGMELSPGTRVYVYFRLGDAETRRGATQAALSHYRKALEIARSAAATDRSWNARSTLRAAHSRLAGAQLESGDLYSARDNLEIALRAAQESVRQPDAIVNERSALLGAYHLFGDVLGNPHDLNLGDRAGALSNYRKALEIGEELVADDRQDVRARGDTAGVYRHIGALLLEKYPTEALNYYRKAFALSEELSDAHPSNIEFRRDVGLTLLGTGESLHKLGKNEEALVSLKRALGRIQASNAAAPDQLAWIRTVSRAYADIGNVLREMGDVDGALDNLRLGLVSAEKLAERAPTNLYFQRDRTDAFETLGRHYLVVSMRPGVSATRRSELRAEARSWFQKSFDVWRDWTRHKVGIPYATWRESQVVAALASVDPR